MKSTSRLSKTECSGRGSIFLHSSLTHWKRIWFPFDGSQKAMSSAGLCCPWAASGEQGHSLSSSLEPRHPLLPQAPTQPTIQPPQPATSYAMKPWGLFNLWSKRPASRPGPTPSSTRPGSRGSQAGTAPCTQAAAAFQTSVTSGPAPPPRPKPGGRRPILWAGTCQVGNRRHQLTWAAEQGKEGGGQAPATKRGHLEWCPRAHWEQPKASWREMVDPGQGVVAWSCSPEPQPSMS